MSNKWLDVPSDIDKHNEALESTKTHVHKLNLPKSKNDVATLIAKKKESKPKTPQPISGWML